MTQEEQETFMLEAVEGLMSLMQALVMTLGKTGALDTEEYARVLLGMRESMVAPGSTQDVLFQRMLQMLVEGDPQVLVRRWGMHAVPTAPEPGHGSE
jgi:hypothetical protein